MLYGAAVVTGASGRAANAHARRLPATAARLRPHWAFVVLLAAGAALRLLTMLAYPPALFFSDSWAYLSTAYAHHLVSLPYLRPVGYSILIRLATTPGHDLTELIVLQHLAGLAIGTLVYATLIRARVSRAVAVLAAALVLLDGYAIALEQYVMPDTFFALTLLLATLLLGWPRLAPTRLGPASIGAGRSVLAGLLIAAAVIEREVALFAIPTMIVYLVWIRAGWRSFVAFLITVAVPLAGYAELMAAKTGVFGITATSGWTLYSRVAGFADCGGVRIAADARSLCETAQQRDSHPRAPDWYMWDFSSPAIRLFHRGRETTAQRARANGILAGFAWRVIRHQPAAFIGATGGDFLRYFTPGATPYADAVSATSLPRSPDRETIDEGVRRHVIPSAHPTVRSPAGFVHGYREVFHVPRPVLALLALAALIALALRVKPRREVTLFAGTALVLLLGTAATAGFGLRYLLPAVPLLAIGGALAASELAGRVGRRVS